MYALCCTSYVSVRAQDIWVCVCCTQTHTHYYCSDSIVSNVVTSYSFFNLFHFFRFIIYMFMFIHTFVLHTQWFRALIVITIVLYLSGRIKPFVFIFQTIYSNIYVFKSITKWAKIKYKCITWIVNNVQYTTITAATVAILLPLRLIFYLHRNFHESYELTSHTHACLLLWSLNSLHLIITK